MFNLFKKYAIRKRLTIKLHIGCGQNYFDDWINLDINSPKADISHNMTKPLWLFDNTVDFIYSEHFIEHIGVNTATSMLEEFYRVLKPGGVCRIATPDLDYIIAKFMAQDWKEQNWIQEHHLDEIIKTPAEMLNMCFYAWGHRYLYNEEELSRKLSEAGFSNIQRHNFNESGYPDLRNRETRLDSKLILEAIK